MIKSFRHKGLKDFFLNGTKKGIQPKHTQKIADLLDRLHASEVVQDMHFPGSELHPLQGNRSGQWAVRVSGNWRITFKFDEAGAVDVDYVDYH